MFDYFIGDLHCPYCATANGAATKATMQTHIRGSYADGTQLGVGFVFDQRTLTPESLVDTGYALISPPKDPLSPRLLGVWLCLDCKTELWAAIEIVQRRIERVSTVALNRASFEASNYVDDTNAEIQAAALMGISWAEFSERKLSCVEVLRQRLE